MSNFTQFDYLLNAFEAASQHADPASVNYRDKRRALYAYVRDLEARAERAEAAQPDYEAVLSDHRRLVRELDVLINGDGGAARQASLCDIVSQVAAMKVTAPVAEAAQPVPHGWAIERGVGGFDDTRWVCVRNLQSQLGQDFYEDRDPLIFGFLAALAATEPQGERE